METTTVTSTEEAILLRHDDGGITTLTLNRSAQYNALSQAMLTELQASLDSIAADRSVRVVVIAGKGKAFCAGHDLKELRAHTDQNFHKALFDQCSRMMLTINRLPQPVIAQVHGIATAAGCQLVATCGSGRGLRHCPFCRLWYQRGALLLDTRSRFEPQSKP